MNGKSKPLANWANLFFLVLAILISSCNLPAIDGEQFDQSFTFFAQIIDPVDGTRLNLGQQVEVKTLVGTPGSVRSVSLIINGQVNREDLFTNPAFARGTVYQTWTPNAPGTFALQVVLKNDKGQVVSNQVTVIVGDVTPTVSQPTEQTLTPTTTTDTPTVTIEPPTLTVEPSTAPSTPDKPQAIANQNTNCRKGPGTAYDVVWSFQQGQTAPIVGKNQAGAWLVIERLDGGGQCWVAKELVFVRGNLGGIAIIPAPPLPVTPTPTRTVKPTKPAYLTCGDYLDLPTCLADPMGFGNCTWNTGLNVCEVK